MKYHDPLFTTTVGFGVQTTAPAATPVAASKSATSAGTAGNYLSGGDAAGLRITTTDTFILGGWMNITANCPDSMVLTKGILFADTTGEYGIRHRDAGNISATIHTGIPDDFAEATVFSTEGEITQGTKCFVVVWFDGTTLNIKVNANSAASTPAIMLSNPAAGGLFTMFADGGHTNESACALDEWFFCKNPASMANALTAISSAIYNSGSGVRYGSVSAGNKTTMGLVSWWGLDEASGSTRLDLHGSNNLTVGGTITQTPPLVV